MPSCAQSSALYNVYIHIHMYAKTQSHTWTHSYIDSLIHICTGTHILKHIYWYTLSHSYTHSQSFALKHSYSLMHDTHMHSYTFIHKQTQIHTVINTSIYLCILSNTYAYTHACAQTHTPTHTFFLSVWTPLHVAWSSVLCLFYVCIIDMHVCYVRISP